MGLLLNTVHLEYAHTKYMYVYVTLGVRVGLVSDECFDEIVLTYYIVHKNNILTKRSIY